MKKIFLLIYLSISNFAISQPILSKAFYYNLTYLPDSLNPSRTATESFVLLIKDSNTFFSSTNYLKLRKSINGLEKKVSSGAITSIGGNSLPKTKFMSSVYKVFESGKTVQLLDMITHIYGVEYPLLNWKIATDTQTINGLSCKKALVHFAGRDYTAWFSNEIPISEGPYIFKGLPGMVVSIADNDGFYKWELSNISDRADVEIVAYNEKGVKWIRRSEMIYLNTYNGRRTRMVEAGIFDSEWSGMSKEDMTKRLEQNLRRDNNQIEIRE